MTNAELAQKWGVDPQGLQDTLDYLDRHHMRWMEHHVTTGLHVLEPSQVKAKVTPENAAMGAAAGLDPMVISLILQVLQQFLPLIGQFLATWLQHLLPTPPKPQGGSA